MNGWLDARNSQCFFCLRKELIPIGQEKSPALNMHFAFACVWATTTEVCPPFWIFLTQSQVFFVVSRGQVRRLLQFGDLLNRCKTKVESAELALPTVPCIDLSVPALCRAVQPCNGCHFASQWSTVAWRLRPHSRLNMKKTKVESASWCNWPRENSDWWLVHGVVCTQQLWFRCPRDLPDVSRRNGLSDD